MKFSEIAKGTTKEKPVKFVYQGHEVQTVLRPLTMGEEVDVIANAVKGAQRRGVKDPKPGDAIYESYVKAETLVLACLDPESPEVAREQTFDGGVEQVFELGDDDANILFEQQALHQEECSPSIHRVSTKDLMKIAQEVSERGDPFLYVALPQLTRWRLQRFTALLLCNSPAYRSLCSLISSDTDFESAEGRAKLLETIRQMDRATRSSEPSKPPSEP